LNLADEYNILNVEPAGFSEAFSSSRICVNRLIKLYSQVHISEEDLLAELKDNTVHDICYNIDASIETVKSKGANNSIEQMEGLHEI